jgi:hypothetical protein
MLIFAITLTGFLTLFHIFSIFRLMLLFVVTFEVFLLLFDVTLYINFLVNFYDF